MKILKLLLGSAVLCLFMTTSGFSYTITVDGSNVDVGAKDVLKVLTAELKNSGEKTETDWVKDVLDTENITYTVKTEPASIYSVVNETSLYAVKMSSNDPVNDGDYFIIKNAGYWALFENLDDFNWGVFDTTDLPDDMNINSATVSHVTVFDSTSVVTGGDFGHAPEPSTLLLFGAGLMGLARISRRKN